MDREQLSEHFYKDEFRCPCCGQGGVSVRVVELLEKIRKFCGHPLKIDSGFRCGKHNKEVGGAPKSDHLIGYAADIFCQDGATRRDLLKACFDAEVPVIGIKRNCIHISIGFPRRVFTYDK